MTLTIDAPTTINIHGLFGLRYTGRRRPSMTTIEHRIHRHRGRPDLHSVLDLHADDPLAGWCHASEIRRWQKRFGRHMKARRLPWDQREVVRR